MPSSKSSFRHVLRDRKSSPEIIIVSNENTVFLNPKHLAWKITGMTEITMSITASTGTMENIGFSSGTATVATSDVPIVLNGSDSTSNPYGFNIAEAIVSKIVTANAIRALIFNSLSNKAVSGSIIAQGQSAPCTLAMKEGKAKQESYIAAFNVFPDQLPGNCQTQNIKRTRCRTETINDYRSEYA